MIQDILPHQFNNSFIADTVIQKEDYLFHFKDNALLLKSNEDGLELPTSSDLQGSWDEGIFLFTLNEVQCFLIWDCNVSENSQFSYHEIKFRNPFAQKEIDWVSGVALQLKNWYVAHRFCGKCGSSTVLKTDERALVCPTCHTILFPSISPAIIVAIRCEDKILLARGVHFPEAYFSLVAGYVDVGESIEACIRREVKEEVGLDIKNIRYFSSQPWPFSGSLMIGYIADADAGQTIIIDETEIAEAAWFEPDNLPQFPAGRSIAGEIIEKFRTGMLE